MADTRRADDPAPRCMRPPDGRPAEVHGRGPGPHAGGRGGGVAARDRRDRLHRFGFHAADHAPGERREAWRAFSGGAYDVDGPAGGPGRPGVRAGVLDAGVRVECWALGPLVASAAAYPAFRVRALERSRRQMGEHLLLRVSQRGTTRIRLGGEAVTIRPGALHLFDPGRGFEGAGTETACRVIAIPHRALGYDPSRHPAHMALAADGPAGRMLGGCLEGLFGALPHAPASAAPAMAEGLLGLLRGLLSPVWAQEADRAALERARAAALLRHLDAHFAEPGLDADALGRAVGASRATVYRALAPEGGVRRAITRRRLRAALGEVAALPPRRGRIGEVAARWGFADAGHFARLCRRELGTTPSEVAGLGAAAWSDGRAA